MAMRSISLRTQLLATIVGSILGTAAALTTLAYRGQVESLERDARRAVHVVAQSRAEAINRLLNGQQQRAQRFLVTAASLCGEQKPSGGTAWEIGCAQSALREFRATERATGALLTHGTRRIARSGATPSERVPVPTPLARLADENGRLVYYVRAENRETAVRLTFGLGELAALFDQPLGLGAGGELLLRTARGGFLTPARFRAAVGPQPFLDTPAGMEPSDFVDVDYRGVEVVHGVYPVTVFSEPLYVDAHLPHDEAMAPARALLADLLSRAAQLAGVGILLALLGAHRMSAPVQRLAASARALERGDFARPIIVRGPSEIRALAAAFAAMARALGVQMAREQQARQDAESANRAKDEFLAVLSHELRTPLTSTLGWTRLLRHGGQQPVQAERAITAIERSAQMQKRLVEDLLDVSRIVAGRLQLERTSVHLVDPVRTAVDTLRPLAQDKGVRLECDLSSAPTLKADPVRVQQVVGNLVHNAIKFTPEGGTVSVRVAATPTDAEITVSDTGAGIAAEFLPHVFEPFRQADAGPRRAYGGLGLGLSIANHLVKLHGGTITATSGGERTGATFTVRLPLAAAAPGSDTANVFRDRPVAAGSTHRLDNVRILVVEDDEATRQVVAALLEDAGATVDDVATAAEGHRRLRERRYSAIVSDLAMPEEDGFAFIRSVRSSLTSVPALALTGLARREDAMAAYDAGFQVCLTKPVDRDQLVTTIAELTLRKTA
jgi:signal transduction histidine kinase